MEGKLLGTITVDTKSELRDMELSRIGDTKAPILTVAAGNKVYFYDLNQTIGSEKSLLKSHTMPIHFRNVSIFCALQLMCSRGVTPMTFF